MLNLGFGRSCSLQEDTDPVVRIQSKPAAQRSWRMQQTVLAREHGDKAVVGCFEPALDCQADGVMWTASGQAV